MQPSNLHQHLGGRDITRLIRSFSGAHPTTYQLTPSEVIADIKDLGYSPEVVLTNLVYGLREQREQERRVKPYRPIYDLIDQLDQQDKINYWSMNYYPDYRTMTLVLNWEGKNRIAGGPIIPLMSGLVRAGYQGVMVHEDPTNLTITLSQNSSDNSVPGLYEALFFFDTQGTGDDIQLKYSSTWYPLNELGLPTQPLM